MAPGRTHAARMQASLGGFLALDLRPGLLVDDVPFTAVGSVYTSIGEWVPIVALIPVLALLLLTGLGRFVKPGRGVAADAA